MHCLWCAASARHHTQSTGSRAAQAVEHLDCCRHVREGSCTVQNHLRHHIQLVFILHWQLHLVPLLLLTVTERAIRQAGCCHYRFSHIGQFVECCTVAPEACESLKGQPVRTAIRRTTEMRLGCITSIGHDTLSLQRPSHYSNVCQGLAY